MKNIFVDCGTHLCEGLDYFLKLYNMDETWEIHTFEPNPNLHASISHYIRNNFPEWKITFHPFAVGAMNGPEKVLLGMQPDGPSGRLTGGGTSIVNPVDFKDGETEGYKNVVVPATPLVEIIKSLTLKACEEDRSLASTENGNLTIDRNKCNIVLKLDIEGAEYAVLADLIETGIGFWLSHLHVEFHHRRFKSEKELRESEIQLVGKLFQMGVVCHPHW